MKIISKFHDYYDIALAQGHDNSIIYLREEREEKFLLQCEGTSYLNSIYKELPYIDTYNAYYDYKGRKIRFIGFCGKIYPYIVFKHILKDNLSKIERILYNSNDVMNFFTEYDLKKELENFMFPQKEKLNKWNRQEKFNINTFTKYIDKYSGKAGCEEIFLKYKVPIFIIELDFYYKRVWSGKHTFEEGKIILNPCLKDIEFFRLINPYVAFQEIEMFLSGVLGFPSPPMIEITDKDKLTKQGFDKWSFRKMPTKKVK